MSDYIPEELIFEEVLTRLPVKSLGRFRCVSKSWCAQINSPQFIKLHYNRRKKSNSCEVKIVVGGNDYVNYKLHSIDLEKIFENNAKEQIKLPPKLRKWHFNFGCEILGSSNGLVCIGLLAATAPETIIILNPFTKKRWILPSFTVYSYAQVKEARFEYGFGYDEASDDYKLVVMAQFRISKTGSTYEIVVYSLKSNSWRKVGDSLFQGSTIISNERNAVLVGNSLHWIMEDDESRVSFIAAFDLSTEQFFNLPVPEYGGDHIHMEVTLGSLNDCLCAVFHDRFDITVSAQMWVMNDYGFQDSWTKFTLKELPIWVPCDSVTPLSCLNNSFEQMVVQVNGIDLVLYNLQDNTIVDYIDNMNCLVARVCFGSLFQPAPAGGGDRGSGRAKGKAAKSQRAPGGGGDGDGEIGRAKKLPKCEDVGTR